MLRTSAASLSDRFSGSRRVQTSSTGYKNVYTIVYTTPRRPAGCSSHPADTGQQILRCRCSERPGRVLKPGGGSKMASESAQERTVTLAWRTPRAVFPPQSPNVHDGSMMKLLRREIDGNARIIVTPSKYSMCSSTQKVKRVLLSEHMAAEGRFTDRVYV